MEGIFLGVKLRSDEVIVGTSEGVIKTRTIKRLPEDKQWDKEFLWNLKGSPKQPDPKVNSRVIKSSLSRKDEVDDVRIPTSRSEDQNRKRPQWPNRMYPARKMRGACTSGSARWRSMALRRVVRDAVRRRGGEWRHTARRAGIACARPCWKMTRGGRG